MATPSYPGAPLRLGDVGNDVQRKQIQLNRISTNYPAIPKIYPVDGVFGQETEDAVRAFQRLFRLTEDGIIGKSTWYRITYLYTAVKRLSELDSEGISLEDIQQQYSTLLRLGDSGPDVRAIQYFLAVIAAFYDTIPTVGVTGEFDQATQDAVIALQNTFGLTPTALWEEKPGSRCITPTAESWRPPTVSRAAPACIPAPPSASVHRGNTSA